MICIGTTLPSGDPLIFSLVSKVLKEEIATESDSISEAGLMVRWWAMV